MLKVPGVPTVPEVRESGGAVKLRTTHVQALEAPAAPRVPCPGMTHDDFMRAALDEARRGLTMGEVPVGAVLVAGGVIVARSCNQPISAIDPTAHAEILVLREAAQKSHNYRLTDAAVYVTVEPCLMCVGALVHARVREVVYGASEPKTGALTSAVHGLDLPGLNHRFAVTGGVLEEECRALMQAFFKERR